MQPMMKSPNTMVATEPGHYMPEVDTPFAKAVNLTIDAGFEKDKGRRRRRLITRKYKARLKTEKETPPSRGRAPRG